MPCLMEIDQVAIERQLLERAKKGDAAALADIRAMLHNLHLYMHLLSLDPTKEYEMVTLRELEGANLLDEIRCNPGPTTPVTEEIAKERYRQIYEEGFNFPNDDEQVRGQLAAAASCYARRAAKRNDYNVSIEGTPIEWPWSDKWWKPKDARSNLIRAAALIVAEIERLDRKAKREMG